ncbi:hypothetical protein LEP1GSC186_4204 [Leptospira noguchii serovar Autumnalis str. ZUN142]|uniref:Uncharacterized protein n=1 Tax=Leptospira noguchii serovar Autumnalis str. ZUN142 TaxID=1085540 RepID=M6UCJ5_9LEPT|nr:hypothetical protein LEP1GSC186_4204 [Leptospira noguchii serovar Autumnalis str. ZUN142]
MRKRLLCSERKIEFKFRRNWVKKNSMKRFLRKRFAEFRKSLY